MPGILTSRLGKAALVVQPPGERDRHSGVVGGIGRDFQRYVPVRALGLLPLRPEQGRRLGQVLQRQDIHQVLSISDTFPRQAGQRAVILRSGGHGMPEDRRVGRQPGDRQVTHVTCQRPGAQHDPVDAVQPQALAKCVQPPRGIQLSVHANLPDRPNTVIFARSEPQVQAMAARSAGGTIIGPIRFPLPSHPACQRRIVSRDVPAVLVDLALCSDQGGRRCGSGRSAPLRASTPAGDPAELSRETGRWRPGPAAHAC